MGPGEGNRRTGSRSTGAVRVLVAAAAAAFLQAAGATASSEGPLAIRAGRIETVAGEPIENGVILIANGRIEAIGTDVKVPEGAEVIDARDGVVCPGFVNPATALGLAARSSGGAAANAHYRTADELYPFQDAYKHAARAGFTTLALWRSVYGIAGQAAVARPVADSAEEMLVSDRGPVVVGFRADTETRSLIKKQLDAAANKQTASRGDKTASLVWATQGEVPLIVQCASSGDIVHALKLLEAYKKAKPVLSGSSRAVYRVIDQLGKKKANIIIPAAIAFEPNTRNRVNIPMLLAKAGAKIACVPASDSVAGYEGLRQSMAELVRGGLTRESALRAVTMNPAEMLGLDYRLGSLDKGKDANLIILSGDVLDARSRVLRVLIEGETAYDAEWGGLR